MWCCGSPVLKAAPNSATLSVMAESTPMPSQRRSRRFCWRSASMPIPPSPSAICAMRASSWSPGTHSLSRPQRSACRAPMFSPVSSSQLARVPPICAGIMAAWITEGMPTLTSGMPTTASSAAMRRSAAMASSSPPPSVWPCSRAITGTGKCRTALHRSRSPLMKARAEAALSDAISRMSAPATKARVPDPRSTRQCRSGRSASSANCAVSARITGVPRMFSGPPPVMVSTAVCGVGKVTCACTADLLKVSRIRCRGSAGTRRGWSAPPSA